MRKLTVHERKTLKGFANQVINLTNNGKEMDLSPKEEKLLRKLASRYAIDQYSFVHEWIEAFPGMTKDEAIMTMHIAFQGVDEKIVEAWKERLGVED